MCIRDRSTPVTPQSSGMATPSENNAAGSHQAVQTETSEEEDLFDREEVMKFINDAGSVSYTHLDVYKRRLEGRDSKHGSSNESV